MTVNLKFKIIRFVGVSIGLMTLLSGIANILGFIPYSYSEPPMAERALSSLPSLLSGFVLLIPHRIFSLGVKFKSLMLAYLFVSLAASALLVEGLISFSAGSKSWHVVPLGIFILLIPLTNAYALYRRHSSDSVAT